MLPDYDEVPNWPPPEISDIVYDTASTEFHRFLRDNSFNKFPNWSVEASHSIRYLIEVKTTTGSCSTPFFMSKKQYQLMREHALGAGEEMIEAPKTVYVIARVYNLLGNNIKMALFVDPWHLKDDVLEFVADPWKVIAPEPGRTRH